MYLLKREYAWTLQQVENPEGFSLLLVVKFISKDLEDKNVIWAIEVSPAVAHYEWPSIVFSFISAVKCACKRESHNQNIYKNRLLRAYFVDQKPMKKASEHLTESKGDHAI